MLTFHGFGDESVGSVARFTRASSIHCRNPVLVRMAFLHSVVREFLATHGLLVELHPPSGGDVSALDVVAHDGRAAVADGRRPFDGDVVLVAVHKLRLSGLARNICIHTQ